MDVLDFFNGIIESRRNGCATGVCSVCSAHPMVLQAAMENALERDAPVLVEATANQVNQYGGYTGMTPERFRDFVYSLAQKCGFPAQRIILGGDHLGPFVWRERPAEEAMLLSEELVRAYVLAGFAKIHLDTSMHLGDDRKDSALDDETIAGRGARLCTAAEEAFSMRRERDILVTAPVYVIGSEVPSPGGLSGDEEALRPTSPERFIRSFEAFRDAFCDSGLADAFSRIVAFVVQPGVEFDCDTVYDYDSRAARELCAAIDKTGHSLVFEGHSTDYQTHDALSQLMRDGFGILKVGPALTFALREALIALEAVEKELLAGCDTRLSGFSDALEAVMLADPRHWRAYYTGSENEKRLARRYSYLDRSRYYLSERQVSQAIETLCDNLSSSGIPEVMLSQYLPSCYARVRAGELRNNPRSILREHIKATLRAYDIEPGGRSAT